MRKRMFKLTALSMALSMVLCCGVAYAAETDGPDYSGYEKGVTVEKDENSPTGYTATFIYEEQESYEGLAGDIALVELYSDCMMLFSYDEVPSGTSINDGSDFPHSPSEYEPGLYPAGGSGATAYYVELTEFADGLWGVQVPLSSGAFVYNFRVTDEEGAQKSRLDDPSNPTLTNSATGIRSLSSMVYVPYSAEAMGDGEWADRSVELPCTSGKTGTVETVSYTGADKTAHGLAVYLPYGYDAERSEPYKVLYLSHGTSGDVYGDELRWMHEGAVANIMDNLIAQGKAEPFVVVTMNNQQFSTGEGHQGPAWDYSLIEEDQIEYIMPYVEAHYNVSKEASGRAYAGLSMGGYTASNMLLYHGDLFSYYGVWSYANVDGIQDKELQESLAKLEVAPHVLTAAGSWDWLLTSVQDFDAELEKLDIDHAFLEVPAAHDWENWQMTYAYAVENFFWKSADSAPVDVSFEDVSDGDWYAEAVKFCCEKGLMTGLDNGSTFSPEASASGSTVLAALQKLDGGSGPAIDWAVENEVVSDSFNADEAVSREQLAQLLYAYASYKGYDVTADEELSAFEDLSQIDEEALPAMQWAVASGLVRGTSASSLEPAADASRCQLATVLMRFCENVVK